MVRKKLKGKTARLTAEETEQTRAAPLAVLLRSGGAEEMRGVIKGG
jgi:hypothetical protein